jgi:carbamoyl-phosphate synthase small subunit
MSQEFNAIIALETGEFFTGLSAFTHKPIVAELCFTTSLTGYQEIMTDPSYLNQIVVFSFPHIGNVGTTPQDNEHKKIWASAFIMGEAITLPSTYRSKEGLYSFLKKQMVPFIWNTDTRALVKCISRTSNPVRAAIYSTLKEYKEVDVAKLVTMAGSCRKLSGQFLSEPFLRKCQLKLATRDKIPSKEKQVSQKSHVGVLDFGAKASIFQKLKSQEINVEILPFDVSPENLSEWYDGLVISNGPGDPEAIPTAIIENIRMLLKFDIPILGICLGFQIIGKALGARFRQLGCGHHGTNHPVQDLESGKVLITSQNHEFVMDEEKVPNNISISHRSLFDSTPEGFRVKGKKIYAYQFHPEASPGPNESEYLLEEFVRKLP